MESEGLTPSRAWTDRRTDRVWNSVPVRDRLTDQLCECLVVFLCLTRFAVFLTDKLGACVRLIGCLTDLIKCATDKEVV